MTNAQHQRWSTTNKVALVLVVVLTAVLGVHLWMQYQEQQRLKDSYACGFKQLGDAYTYGTYDPDECED
jgi:hypothetical protein